MGEGPYGALLAVLEESKGRGFLGPGPVADHIDRALDGLVFLPPAPGHYLDMGSGGGIPGLPLVMARPETWWVLLDGSVTRAAFLTEAVGRLGLDERVSVLAARAEEAGRQPDLRGAFDGVVARSFGAPAVTAECAAPFLRVGGQLIVAEPPGGDQGRWPAGPLQQLGLRPTAGITEPSAFQVLVMDAPCPARFPRRVGVPAKRPLY